VTLRVSYECGARAALAKFAGALGADAGVMPSGPEQSHGTERIQYAQRDAPKDGATPLEGSAAAASMPDWLWDNFTTYDRAAPGRADGTWGQEVIG
jgi:hypothetical protein